MKRKIKTDEKRQWLAQNEKPGPTPKPEDY